MPASVSTITAGRPLWALRICSFSGAAAQNRARLTGSSASCLNSWSRSQASPRYQTRFRSTLAAWSSGSRTVSPCPCAGSISSQLCSIFLILSVQRIFSPFSGRKKAPAAFPAFAFVRVLRFFHLSYITLL